MGIAKRDVNAGILTTFDEQSGRLPLLEWMGLYFKKTGIALNAGTMRKRRAVSGLGLLVPPKVYVFTKEEFLKVIETPLPFCTSVIKSELETKA